MSIGPVPAKATSDELSPLPSPANPAVRPKKPRCEVSHSVQWHTLKWRQSLGTADPMSVGREVSAAFQELSPYFVGDSDGN